MKKFLILFLLVTAITVSGCWRKTPQPVTNTNKPAATTTSDITGDENIHISNLHANDVLKNPLVIKGEAIGGWYFEGSFPINVVDNTGTILAQEPAQAQGEWMTTDFVPFEAELILKPTTATSGFIIFKKDNPSGMPEHDASFKLPVQFAQ